MRQRGQSLDIRRDAPSPFPSSALVHLPAAAAPGPFMQAVLEAAATQPAPAAVLPPFGGGGGQARPLYAQSGHVFSLADWENVLPSELLTEAATGSVDDELAAALPGYALPPGTF